MSGNEIRKLINQNNLKIQEKLKTFVLTDDIKVLMAQNQDLRKQCEHHFIDGVCEYCDSFEGEIYDS